MDVADDAAADEDVLDGALFGRKGFVVSVGVFFFSPLSLWIRMGWAGMGWALEGVEGERRFRFALLLSCAALLLCGGGGTVGSEQIIPGGGT